MTCFFGAKFNCHVKRFCLARFDRIDAGLVRFCGMINGLGLRSILITLMPLNSSKASEFVCFIFVVRLVSERQKEREREKERDVLVS